MPSLAAFPCFQLRIAEDIDMKTTPVLVGVAGIAFAAAAAQAQGLTQAWTQASPMTPQDRAIILSTADAQIHGRPPGTVAKWSNPDGGHSGTITLLSKSTRKGMPCERIEYKILEPGATRQHGRYVFTSCKISDGSWKFAD
jgi:surface antigen